MDRTIIDQYAAGGDLLGRGIAGLGAEDLNSHPVPNTWSIQQIVMHMMDSDLIGSDRMKRIIAEDHPLIIGYDETRFAERLHYERMDPRAACELFALNRRVTASLLRELSDDTFMRWGIHSQVGKITLGQMIKGYHDHLHHHFKFLNAKRRAMGKLPVE